MNRIEYDDGHWFDADKAERLTPEGQPTEYELRTETFGGYETFRFYALWRTRLGTFVIDDATGEIGNRSIPNEIAVRILIKYDLSVPEDLQEELDSLEG